ncbi:MAG: F0F1 ATP synthase subunit alpha [Lentisphaerales bacterium]|nr:MAG: F0F1 ATP synthase subunit alpha [Lentisphaerales bacterium]
MALKINIVQLKESGVVVEVKQDIAHINGLSNCMNGQLVQFPAGSEGVIVGFNEDYALVLLVHEGGPVKPGDKVTSSLETFSIPVGNEFIGRTVNALGKAADGGPTIHGEKKYPIFGTAPSVLDRIPLTEVFASGTKIVDMMIPLGKGQRELIIGDRMTGKTTIATDAILTQKNTGVICIYCCIGKAEASLQKVMEIFNENDVWKYGLIVSATASDSMGQQYLAPYVATSIGEYFMYEHGKDVLVVFDDLTKHAWTYRQMSLLLERSPGRDAYPGDIFYLHSQLVERACKLSPQLGGGSMTHLPIIETLQGDVTGYIPSNTISMTDGQIYMNSALFGEGFKPAIDLGLSVSRIGSKVQWPAVKELSGMLRLEYVKFKELQKLTRVKAGVSEDVERRLNKGLAVQELLKQLNSRPVPMEEQVVLLYAFRQGVLEGHRPEDIRGVLDAIIKRVKLDKPEVVEELIKVKELTVAMKEALDEEFARFRHTAV